LECSNHATPYHPSQTPTSWTQIVIVS
jgi:hypothetical protein